MIDTNAVAAPQATPATLLDESLERYKNALDRLKIPENSSSEQEDRIFDQIVEVLIARDVVEKRLEKDENPSGASIAKLINLDSALREQHKKISGNVQLKEHRKKLSQWKKERNISSTYWWWQLTDPEDEAEQVVKDYEEKLSKLEKAVDKPSTQEIIATQEILEVLQARDKVAKICSGEKKPSTNRIKEIMELDERLWKKAAAIAQDEKLDEWKVHINPPASSWWWQIAEAPYFIQCIKRYETALDDYEAALYSEFDLEPSSKTKLALTKQALSTQALKLLKARDAVENALKNQPSISEKIADKLIELDQKLKQQRLALTRGKQLLVWKKSLRPPESHWWWNFRPSIFGEEDEPMPLKDRLWILAALGCIGIAASIALNTSQRFQTLGQDKQTVQSDAVQNSLVLGQGAGLLGLGGATATQKGRKFIENVLTSIPFIRPQWQAQATFGLSFAALGIVYGINQSLPKLGYWYFERGQNLVDEGQSYKAEEQFRQAKKLLADADDKARVTLALGKVYEEQDNFTDAIKEYQSALATDNPEVKLHLGRAMLFDGLAKVGWTGKIKDEEVIRKAESYFAQVEAQASKSKAKTSKSQLKNSSSNQDTETERIRKDTYINQGILAWSQVDLNKPKPSDKELLEKAHKYFDDAKSLDDKLPTTSDSRNVRCYLELANDLINREQAKDLESSYCGKIISYGNIEDSNEAALMTNVGKLVAPKGSIFDTKQ